MKIKEVIEKILLYHPQILDYEGCDDYKCGNPERNALELYPLWFQLLRSYKRQPH